MAPPKTNSPPNREDDEEERISHQKPYILQIPNHVMVEIFSKMTVPSLIQCRRVCKSWRRSLSEPQFTKALLSQTPPGLLLKLKTKRRHKGEDKPKWQGFLFVGLDKAVDGNHVVMKMKLFEDPNVPISDVEIVGSCNGLLCLYQPGNKPYYYHRFYISNPITGEVLPLPPVSRGHTSDCFGFGYSSESDVYKVVIVGSSGKLRVMTVGSGNWRRIGISVLPNVQHLLPNSYQGGQLYFNGCLHWLVPGENDTFFICAFNVESERLQLLRLPPGCSIMAFTLELGIIKGCLSVTTNTTLWLMKEYGIKESWTRECILHDIESPRIKLLKFTEEGQFLLLLNGKLQTYTPGTRSLSTIKVDGIPSAVDMSCFYTPSFVLLKDVIRG